MKLSIRSFAIILFLSIGLVGAEKDQTLTGTVSDTMCGSVHMISEPAADCIRECPKHGNDYALIVGTKLYMLKGNKIDIDKYAGQQVTVTGKVSGNVIHAASIAPAKKG